MPVGIVRIICFAFTPALSAIQRYLILLPKSIFMVVLKGSNAPGSV